jgi:hypothetical protein
MTSGIASRAVSSSASCNLLLCSLPGGPEFDTTVHCPCIAKLKLSPQQTVEAYRVERC